MDEVEIRDRFVAAIMAAAAATGRELGQGNQHYLPALAADAAAAIVARTADDAERRNLVAVGEAAYRDLVNEMAQAARSLPGYPDDILGEQTLALAQQARGPFPPFW
jgi:hypothetical protein